LKGDFFFSAADRSRGLLRFFYSKKKGFFSKFCGQNSKKVKPQSANFEAPKRCLTIISITEEALWMKD